jgi:hypothetical protein
MNRGRMFAIGMTMAALAAFAAFRAEAGSAPDKYTVKVPGGLAFSDFKGYESWQLISISQNGKVVAAILGNPTIIDAYKAGIPGNGKPFPDGSKMAKIHWLPKQNVSAPGPPTVPSTLKNVDFMVKDSKKFADSGGWGWAAFEYDTASDTFTPATTSDTPPQGHDAKCGFTCHTKAQARDLVFTEYARR